MSTPFQSAMNAFVLASINHDVLLHNPHTLEQEDASERALAQTGDVLESALRQMMREEAARAVRENVDWNP